jgi:hypothetical protein
MSFQSPKLELDSGDSVESGGMPEDARVACTVEITDASNLEAGTIH